MGIEYELKFSAEQAQHQRIRSVLGPMEGCIAMETIYYDTPGRALSARKVTLRRRMENGVPVCTVKTPAGEAGRGEWECQCDDITAGIPILCKLGAPKELLLLTAEGVIPICGARFTRETKLFTGDGFTAELALDTGVLTGGDREEALCEVELELKSGSREALNDYAADFARQFRLEAQPKSKFRRALALAEGVRYGQS